MAIDVTVAKKRLLTMALIDVAALIAALAAIAVHFAAHVSAALIAFAVALVIGFAAQIWFIAGLRRAKEGA